MGTVFLIGTGPGDPGLLTLRAARLLQDADVVLHDDAVSEAVLETVPEEVPRYRLGAPGGQDAGERLTALAGEHRKVVRLFGGDPMMQATGAEEAGALADAGVPYEIVPGIPSSLATAACSGIPLVSNETSTVTLSAGGSSVARERLLATAAEGETVVLEIEGSEVQKTVSALASGAGGADLPAALVTGAATPRQRVRMGTLAELAAAGVEPFSREAVLIVGAGVGQRERLSWYEERPLFGRRIVVTRPRAQANEFVARLEELGAEVIPFATIRITDPPDLEVLRAAVRRADSFDWIVFTSVNGVHRFWRELRETGRDTRVLAGVSLCAIGPATAAAIELEGASADLMPEEHVAEAVVEALAAQGDLRGSRILLSRAAEARSVLPESLRARGAEVLDVAAYRTVADASAAGRLKRLLLEGEVDLITFTASSTVRNFLASVGLDIPRVGVACIGPITSATAREAGLDVTIEAREYTIPGLTEAIVRHYQEERP
jgi:uroporphyrinogen III methyltransferase / synthase